ncbi:MAG TPA: hypothetical protein VFW76_10620 [Ktedonobacterales bacterium]|nr:hypothetical protein [Ktedonobacterales bacterium]
MSLLIERAIREPDVQTPQRYAQRVHRLAWAYAGLCAGSLAGIALVVWKAQFYVTLSQRSNVETLTLAFLFIFFAYLTVLSIPGVLGASRMLYYTLLAHRQPNREVGERRKMRALGGAPGNPAIVGMNIALERADQPGASFALPVADPTGSMGEIVVDGAKLTYHQTIKVGSNALLAFFVQQVNRVLEERGATAGVDVVEWKSINDEATEQYLSVATFARNLERHLNAEGLWPRRVLNGDDCAELEKQLTAVCPALRNEAFLPRWEYEGQHQVPLIPEPLGFISLTRSEKRVDPLASMGCAVIIVLVMVFILALIIVFPPWVPGS